MADERDEIRARIDIVDLVSQQVRLKRTGKYFTGLCPFHADKRPSFTVDPTTGRYKCWSCNESGDIFTWVMKTRNIDFVEALRELADRAGVQLKQSATPEQISLREVHRAEMNEALAFFRTQFERSTVAQTYCQNRGLDAETLSTWEIGYAPDVRDALAQHIKKKGMSLAEGKNLFLVVQDQQGGYRDQFYGRLIFPIRDEKGDLVAFGGRLLGDGHPKYINSSDTPLYRKSRVLYGMQRARQHFSTERRAVLVEGYLDVIACHRAGVQSAVASLGTSLSEEHAKLLKRWVDEVVILYDSDRAGQKAAERAVGILETEGLRVRVALMPEGEDPDTLLRHAGPAAVVKSVGMGLSPMQYRLQALRLRLQPTEPQFWDEVVEVLSESESDLEASANLNEIASLYPGVKDVTEAVRVLKGMIAQRKHAKAPQTPQNPRPRPRAEEVRINVPMTSSEIVVFRALHDPTFQRFAWMTIMGGLRSGLFVTSSALAMAKAIAETFPSGPPVGNSIQWLPQVKDSELQSALADVAMDPRGGPLSEDFLADTITVLRTAAEKRTLQDLKRKDLSADERQAVLERLRRLNPYPRNKSASSDEDPFA